MVVIGLRGRHAALQPRRSDDGTLLQWELDDAEAAGRAPRFVGYTTAPLGGSTSQQRAQLAAQAAELRARALRRSWSTRDPRSP